MMGKGSGVKMSARALDALDPLGILIPNRATRRLLRAGDRTRTGDVQLGKLAFYQLNYARELNRIYQ